MINGPLTILARALCHSAGVREIECRYNLDGKWIVEMTLAKQTLRGSGENIEQAMLMLSMKIGDSR